jgi:peptidoglycan/xylan/chitin deacetylase (PgdA/CDA1 family)
MRLLRQTMKALLAATVPAQMLLVRRPGKPHQQQREANSSACEGFQRDFAAAQIALTFDDGPHPEHTPRLLDALAVAGIHATFFVVGDRARRHPELIRRIASAGHDLGNHTYTHAEPSKTACQVFLAEVRQTRSLLQELTGTDCTLFRPPKGKLSPTKLLGLWRMAQTVVLWNIDPRDFRMRHSDEMREWCSTYEPVDGDIVLMHDNQPYALSAIEFLTAGETRDRVEPAQPARPSRLAGCRFVRISDWLNQRSDAFTLARNGA